MAITDFATDVASIDGAPAPELSVAAIRAALARYARTDDPAELQRGLDAGRALLRALAVDGAAEPDVARLRRLARACPEFAALLDAAADAAAGALAQAGETLWAALGLHRAPPRWTEAEREAARMIFACGCAAPDGGSADWLSASLRRVAAPRIAAQLCEELSCGEAVWLRALGDRYGSLRHRCAPRTALRSRGLADLLRVDPACRVAVQHGVERWLSGGAWIDELAAELEAAVVHARTPARLA